MDASTADVDQAHSRSGQGTYTTLAAPPDAHLVANSLLTRCVCVLPVHVQAEVQDWDAPGAQWARRCTASMN